MKYTKGISHTLRTATVALLSCIMIVALILAGVYAVPSTSALAEEEQPTALYILGDESVIGKYGAETVDNDPVANGYRIVSQTNGVATYTYSKFASGWAAAMQEAVETVVEVRLASDWTATATDRIVDGIAVRTEFGNAELSAFNGGRVTVPENASVVLDLNGYVIDRNLKDVVVVSDSEIYSVLFVDALASLVLKDGKADSTHDDGVEVVGGIVTGGSNGNGGGVYVGSNATFTMDGGSIVGNTATRGGGVYMDRISTFTMNGGYIGGNDAGDGAGVYVSNNSHLTMEGGKIEGNTAAYYGGGVYAVGIFSMNGGYIGKNNATDGAGVFVNEQFMLTDGEIVENTASGNGGGVYAASSFVMRGGMVGANEAVDGAGVYSDKFTLIGGDIIENTASGNGGGVYATSFVMRGGLVSDNVAVNGGGVYADEFTLINGRINHNIVSGDGAGVYAVGIFTMNYGAIVLNEATGNGGGVFVDSTSTFTMNDGDIKNNTANSGGGVYADGTFKMESGEIAQNSATDGAGFYVNGTVTVNGGTVGGNEATGNGGGVYVNGTFTMTNGFITGNKATENGGGVYVNAGNGVAFNLSGTPKIYGNLKGEAANDVYLMKTVTVNGVLQDGARVGIASDLTPFIGSYNVTLCQHPSKHFFADDETKIIAVEGNAAVLKEKPVSLPAYTLVYGEAEGTVDGNVITYVYKNGSTLSYDVDGDFDPTVTVTGAASDLNDVTNAGTYYVAFATDDYVKAYTVIIEPQALTEADLTIPALPSCGNGEEHEYNYGEAHEPAVTGIKFGEITLDASDYTVDYRHNVNPGRASATVSFQGNYSGEIVLYYDIVLSSGNYNVVWEYYVNGSWTTTQPTYKFLPGEQGDQLAYVRARFEHTESGIRKYAYAVGVTEYHDDYVSAENENLCAVRIEFEYLNDHSWNTFRGVGEYKVTLNSTTEDGRNIVYGALTLTMAQHDVNVDIEQGVLDVQIIGADEIAYDGTAQTPEITVDLNSLLLTKDIDYVVEYLNNVEGGTATVKITFIGNYTGDPVEYEFTVQKVTNSWASQLNVVSWDCGEFDAEKNVFIAVPTYLSASEYVRFSIYALNGETPILKDIVVKRTEDAVYGPCYQAANSVVAARINELGAGTYRLEARVEETNSYYGLDPLSITFSILKAQNTFIELPNIHSWKYDSFNADYNLPGGTALHGTVVFVITDESDREVYNSATGLNELATANAGDYTLTASVAETGAYDGLMPVTVPFVVDRAENSFTVQPNIKSWTYNSFDARYNLPEGEAMYGTAVLVVTDEQGTQVYHNIKGINELAKLHRGTYTLTVTTENSGNYAGLEREIKFDVTKAINTFTVMPNIRTWKYGSYQKEYNLPEAEALSGEGKVLIYVSDQNGRTIYYNNRTGKDNLASLAAGDYILTAITDTDSDYEGLTIQQRFTVAKAVNTFIDNPSIPVWRYGEYDPTVNVPTAKAKWGDTHIVITNIVDNIAGDEIYYDSETDLDLLGNLEVGVYRLTATVQEGDNYEYLPYWYDFTVTPCPNSWVDGELPFIESWVTGKFTDENLPVANATFGTVVTVITTIASGEEEEGEVIFDSSKGINKLKDLDPGTYYMKSYVEGTDNYYYMEYSRFFKVLEPVGLPWWATLLITVGALGLAALILFILWKLGVFQILTNKLAMALIKRATVDATIAAVRANKRTNEANEHVSKVKAQERLDAAREAQRNMTPEEMIEAMRAKADETSQKATEMQAKAGKMRNVASKYGSNPTEETLEEYNAILTEEEFVEQFHNVSTEKPAEQPEVAPKAEEPAEQPDEATEEKPAE